MSFAHPLIFWLALGAAAGLALFFWWAWRKKQRLMAQFIRSRLLASLTFGISTGRQKARLVLAVLAVTLLVLALARPRWGFDWEEARQRGLDIVVAIDTSRSMLAADIAPNRLARAKLAALDLKRLARTDRLGLVAFAGSSFLQCPLSFDDEAFRQSVNALDVNIIPMGGSALAEAIQTARAAFKENNDNHKILVLFTDGEDNEGSALEVAEQAAKDGMRIFAIGVGTPNGELLRITDGKERTDYVRDDQGNVIKSRLNEQLLQQIARASGGYYMLLSGADTMRSLYENALAPLPKSEHTSRRIKRFHERYQWFLASAILLLCAEMLLPERKRARRREPTAASPLAGAAALLLLLLVPATASGAASSGFKNYRAGNYAAALQEFEKLLHARPNDPLLHYNVGTAAYQTGDYPRALNHFNSALLTQDLRLQQKAYYNLGNTAFRIAEAESELLAKEKTWQDATNHYHRAVRLNPRDADASFNLKVVETRLEAIEAGRAAKRAADKALADGQYARALEMMEHQHPMMQDHYSEFIEKLRELNRIDAELTKLQKQLEKPAP